MRETTWEIPSHLNAERTERGFIDFEQATSKQLLLFQKICPNLLIKLKILCRCTYTVIGLWAL